MFNKKLFLPLTLALFSMLMIQCTTKNSDVDIPQNVDEVELLGLTSAQATTTVATFREGVPVTTLSEDAYQDMYQRVAQYTQDLEGTLVNYYVEAKEGEDGQHYFLILNGELADGTYMKTGFELLNEGGDMAVSIIGRPRPVYHFSCRGSICNNCNYVLTLSGVDCGCSWGINDCYKYYQDEDPT